jgi:hypothetical protein
MNMKNTPTALRLHPRSRSLSRSATVGVIWDPTVLEKSLRVPPAGSKGFSSFSKKFGSVGGHARVNGNASYAKSFSRIKEPCSIEARHHIVIGLEAQSPVKGLNFRAGNQ